MRRGFTILETLVAFSLLLVTAVFIFQILPASILATRHSEVRLEAQQILSNVLENYRQRDFDTLQLGSYTLDPVAGQLGVNYQPVVSVVQMTATDPDRVLGLEVDVSWTFRSRLYHLRGGSALWRVQR